jgi:type IV pilus assembly protein PilC
MPHYRYKARDAEGKPVEGTMEAATNAELIDMLRKMGYMATRVSEASAAARKGSLLDRIGWIGSADMLMFYIQLSNLLSAGITILMSLATLSKQIENRRLREAVAGVGKQVEAGISLSQAFAAYPGIFSRLFVNMIKAGEESGKLDTVLARYAVFFEQQEELKQKVEGALFYPLILLCAGLAVILFIVTSIMPQFAVIYLKAGIKLPLPTLIVYKAGIVIKYYWHVLAAAAIIVLAGMRFYQKTENGAFLFDRLKLRMFITGPLYRKVVISRFSRTLATLIESGVPILKTLDITQEVMGNKVLGRVIADVHKSVEKGEQMSRVFGLSEEFPADVVQMIAVGEETGNLAGMLNKTADFYDMSVGYAIKRLTTVIEPVFLVIMGAMVGLIMASLLMPIFDMVKTLGR